MVGDIPVHVGDFASPLNSPATVLTTVDENKDLEAYIYIPTERAGQVRQGLDVELMDNTGKLLEKTKIDFLSPQVDSTLQGILVKAPVHATPEMLRNAQMIKARVIWSTTPMAVVPVLAVTRQGGQSFVFVAQQQNGHFAGASDVGHAGRYGGQQLLRLFGAECGRPGDCVEHAVPGERHAGDAAGRIERCPVHGPAALQSNWLRTASRKRDERWRTSSA